MKSLPLLILPFLTLMSCAPQGSERSSAEAKPAAPVAAVPAPTLAPVPEAIAQGLNAQQALERLMAGNKRFVSGQVTATHRDLSRRDEIAKGQHPIAIIVCCSDSRVPPEMVFDVGMGDIFVVRVAGNVLDPIALGSIEYAAEHLHAPLVVVMGHERCGAVTAALGTTAPPQHILSIVENIQHNLKGTTPGAKDPVDHAVRVNCKAVATEISESEPLLKEMVLSGHLRVAAVRYDLDDGTVEGIQ